jgi:hypothetical protein
VLVLGSALGITSAGGLSSDTLDATAASVSPPEAVDSQPLAREGLVLGLGQVGEFDSGELGAPTVILESGMYRMWYFGRSGGASIGYATSMDGWNWVKQGVVLSPTLSAEAGGVLAYPEVLRVGDRLRM